MIGLVGSLPKEWQSQWEEMQRTSKFKLEPYGQSSKLTRKFSEKVHDPQLESLRPVLEGLMRFLPSTRVAASEALGLMGSNIEEYCN